MTDICWASHSCYPQHTHTDSPKPGAWVCTEGRHVWVRAGTLDFGCGLAVPTALDPLCPQHSMWSRGPCTSPWLSFHPVHTY